MVSPWSRYARPPGGTCASRTTCGPRRHQPPTSCACCVSSRNEPRGHTAPSAQSVQSTPCRPCRPCRPRRPNVQGRDVYVVDAVRTPVGRHGGALAEVRPDDLAAHVLRELVGRTPSLDPARIDEVILGDANQAGEDNRNVARMAVLLAGLPTSV